MKVGIIGCGQISRIYAESDKKYPGFKIVACADIEPERAAALAAKFSIPEALDVEDLLRRPEIDVVLNLTIPAAHAEVAMAALKRGKSVYNEKPLALRRRDARELLGYAREKGLRIGCAPDTFLGASLQTCRKLIDEGAIGRPLAASAYMMHGGVEDRHPNPEFFYKKGGGPLFDMGPYYITALVTLLGPVARVTGSTGISFEERTITTEPHAGERIRVDVPTHVAGILEFASGPIATLVLSFDVKAHRMPPVEIYGSEGTLAVPDPNASSGPVLIRRRGDAEWREFPLLAGPTGYARGMGLADMADALRTGAELRASGHLAYHVLDVMHSIYDAAATGRHVELRSTVSRPEPLPCVVAPVPAVETVPEPAAGAAAPAEGGA